MAKCHVTATVNGDVVEFLCEPDETLLDVLRDQLNLTGSKEGCASGDCGACSVMLDGRLVCACLVLGPETEVRYWLAGNLCRCTGYDKIVRAVLDTAAEIRGS